MNEEFQFTVQYVPSKTPGTGWHKPRYWQCSGSISCRADTLEELIAKIQEQMFLRAARK